jgi:hypothetical protein
MSALDHLKQLNRKEVKLEDGGLLVGYHLPDIQECLLAGDIPLPSLKDLPKDPKAEDVLDAMDADRRDMFHATIAFRYRLVGTMLDDVDTVPVTDADDRVAIAKAFTPEQCEQLFRIAQREEDPSSGEA